MESGTRLHSLQIPSSKYQVEPRALNVEMMYKYRLDLESTNHIQFGLFYFYQFFFTIFENVTQPPFFSLLKKNHVSLNTVAPSLIWRIYFTCCTVQPACFLVPLALQLDRNTWWEKTEPQHFSLLADCIKEARVMVSQGYIHPVFCVFFFMLLNWDKSLCKRNPRQPTGNALDFPNGGEHLGNLWFAIGERAAWSAGKV